MPADTLRATIDKFCTLAQLNVVLDKNGDIKFKNARPLFSSTNKIIQIPSNRQYGDFPHSVILNNKYDAVEIDKYSVISKYSFDNNAGETTEIIKDYIYGNSDFNSFYEEGFLGYYIAKIEASYCDGQFIINKKDDNGLKTIKSLATHGVPDEEGYIKVKFDVSYETNAYSGVFKNETQVLKDLEPYNNTSVFASNQYEDNIIFFDDIISTPAELPKEVDTNFYYGDNHFTAKVSDLGWVKIKEFENYYDCKYHIMSKTITYDFSTKNNNTGLFLIELKKYITLRAELNIEGLTFNIDFNSASASSDNIKSATNPIDIQTSELFSNKTTINGTEITEVVKANVLSDYSEGVSNGTITVAVTDYFDNSGNKVIDISKGQTITIGDTINIEGDNRYWRVTGANQRKTGTPYIDLEVMEVKKLKLSDYSWSAIAKISDSGKAKDLFSIGDIKYVESLDSYVRIIGFNHDDLADGSGKAGITFEMVSLYNANTPMNDFATNIGGWADSTIRNDLTGIVMKTLPEDIQSVIKSVKKKSASGGDYQGYIVETEDKLFLLSEVELYGGVNYSIEGEGFQYEYYKNNGVMLNNNTKICIKENDFDSGAEIFYWTRSAVYNDSSSFVVVENQSGSSNTIYANVYNVDEALKLYPSFAFCI